MPIALALLPAFKPLLIFTVLLLLKMSLVGGMTANTRRKSGVVVNPEDTKVNPGTQAAPQEAAETLRVKRAHQNDLENIPGFLILALIFTLAGGSASGGWAYFGLFFAARTLHSIAYLNGLQPWRTLSFFVGLLCQLGLMVQLIMKAL